jgi:acyl transferase domain-containing protein
MSNNTVEYTGLEIAVIGMAVRFPGADNLTEFWKNLVDGVESISFLTEEELQELDIDQNLKENPNFVKSRGGVQESWKYFDASFFGYTPKEADIMAPQQRLFHECAWEAFEMAGYDPETYDKPVGVFAGASNSSEWGLMTVLSGKRFEAGAIAANTLAEKESMPARISYNLDLKGPSMSVNTICSTSLVTIHLACQSLLSGECDMALAGGGRIGFDNKGYMYREGDILSPDGHIRAFDADAKGLVWSDGMGVVLLKTLEEAIKDRDHIYALIKGTAINNDGRQKVGYTAPSVKGQAEVIQAAHIMADVEPETISYIEAHGTGTTMGDPIEIEALKAAFKTEKKNYCAVGSVKTNLGHMAEGAGVGGFIKAVLAIKNKQIPPSLHYKIPNPQINFQDSPFYINNRLADWKNETGPLRAGVSSFAIGGTNAHAILEEAPQMEQSTAAKSYQLIQLSAKSKDALENQARNLARHLENNPGLNLADVAYTLQVGRRGFEYRKRIVCNTIDDAVRALDGEDTGNQRTHYVKTPNPKVVFMFPGLSAQYINMGLELYRQETTFRQEMDHCFEILNRLTGKNIKEILYPAADSSAAGKSDQINTPEIAQQVIFSFEYALAKLLIQWGITPDNMIGYSFGEYVAAAVSGVMTPGDALALIVERGRLIQTMPRGEMLSIPLPPDQVKPELDERLSIAIDNGTSTIVAGSPEAVEDITKQMKAKRLMCMKINATYALHSRMMEPIADAYAEEVGKIKLNKPEIPYISNVTGKPITDEEAVNPQYWANHLKQTVRYADGMQEVIKEPDTVFIEIGPGRELSALVGRIIDEKSRQHTINLVRHPEKNISDYAHLLSRIGDLWLYGKSIDSRGYYNGEQRNRVPLPTYPFERIEHWAGADTMKLLKDSLNQENDPGRKKGIADWFYYPYWKPSALPAPAPSNAQTQGWLLFIENNNNSTTNLKEIFEKRQQDVVVVTPGETFNREGDQTFTINPQRQDDYDTLVEALAKIDFPLQRVLHAWNLDTHKASSRQDNETVDQALEYGFYSLLSLVKAIEKQSSVERLHIDVITAHMQNVTGTESVDPAKSTIMGAVKVIPQEFPHITTSCIDIETTLQVEGKNRRQMELLERELFRESTAISDHTVAYRGNIRWVQYYEPIRLEESSEDNGKIKKNSVILITGGMGNMGLEIAQYLAKTYKARLVLTATSQFPDREDWNRWIADHDETNATSKKIRRLEKIIEAGGDVLALTADIADETQMEDVIEKAENTFGPINGIIHAAGRLPGDLSDTLKSVTRDGCREKLVPKINGVHVLENLLKDKKPDFIMLMSSISSVLGGLGFAAYTAANIYLDAYATQRSRTSDIPWISVAWSDWLYNSQPADNDEGPTTLRKYGMTPAEGIDAMERILAAGNFSHIVQSPGELQARIDRWIKLDTVHADAAHQEHDKTTFRPRPELDNPYMPPQNQLQETLENIWKNLFGFDKIGIHDDFLELGGDSLKAITLISRIHKELNTEVALTDFFSSPTIQKLAQHIEEHSKEHRFVSVEPVEKKEYYPISSAQKRLYVVQQMNQDSHNYNMTHVFSIEGKPDREKIENVFAELIQRHESLRTSIKIVDGITVQQIHDKVNYNLDYYEMRKDEVEEFFKTYVRAFNMTEAPFLRTALIKLTDQTNRNILLIDIHHIITDGVSHNNLVKEFSMLYNGYQLPELKLHYKDFSQWQRRETEKETFKSQKKFWIDQFSDGAPVLQIPTDYPRSEVMSTEGKLISHEINPELTAKLKQMGMELKVTLNTLLIALFNVLLHKYSRQEDIVVGSPVAGRSHVDLQNVIGMFVNMLPIRNKPLPQKTFSQFTREVYTSTLNAYNNQDFQFDELVRELEIQRSTSRNPLFDVALELHNVEIDYRQDSDNDAQKKNNGQLTLTPYEFEVQTSQFDLIMGFRDGEHNMKILLSFSTALFKTSTAERLLEHFVEIIEQLVDNKDMTIEEITLSHGMAAIASNQFGEENLEFDF